MNHNVIRILFIPLAILLFASCNIKGREKTKGSFDCGQMIDFNKRLQSDMVFKAALERLEVETNQYIKILKETNFADFRSTVVTIPVVVHVVYKNASENLSVAQIQSQIVALNEFYRRLNADVSTVSAPFNSLAADIMIEFALAQRDPDCMPTDGITRTSTTVTSFTNAPNTATPQTRNAVKFNVSGGHEGWPSDRYLNLWVCDLADGLIGYASFPSDMAARPTEDGVVMDYSAFGTIGSLNTNLNLGRVCGHEVGHWLNLFHIWGDDPGCVGLPPGSDFVGDTPNQGPNNGGSPSFPHTDACSPTSPGVMFMNQMDYTDDACRRMFTLGQSDRMAATLYTIRNSILSSQGAIPPPVATAVDLWMKDSDEDMGNEPNNESSVFYISDDIWVRNTNDGVVNQESQPAIGGSLNYVYVKVRNRGCMPSGTADLKLYWAKASSGLSWPEPWDGSVTLTGTTLMGDLIGMQSVGSVAGNSYQIFEFQWNNVPDPSDYASLGADLQHFCLLARIEETAAMTHPEVSGNLWGNVQNNNNIVWKNIAVTDVDGNAFSAVLVSNYTREDQLIRIEIDAQKYNRKLNATGRGPGTLYARPGKGLERLIAENRVQINGLEKIENGLYKVIKGIATIDQIMAKPGKQFLLELKFIPDKEFYYQRYVYQVILNQYNGKTQKHIGGQLFKFKKGGN